MWVMLYSPSPKLQNIVIFLSWQIGTLDLREFGLCARNHTDYTEGCPIPKPWSKFTERGKRNKINVKTDIFLMAPKDFSHRRGRSKCNKTFIMLLDKCLMDVSWEHWCWAFNFWVSFPESLVCVQNTVFLTLFSMLWLYLQLAIPWMQSELMDMCPLPGMFFSPCRCIYLETHSLLSFKTLNILDSAKYSIIPIPHQLLHNPISPVILPSLCFKIHIIFFSTRL